MSLNLNRTGLIALMGSTGSGKSAFINAILGEDKAALYDGLESGTSEVGQYLHIHPSGMNVEIVDTPGFNDYRAEGSKSDLKVLQTIGRFLKDQYDANQKFSGVIFMHNINTANVDWQTQRRNMTLFKKLCGTDSMKNVVVVTTFWDELSNISDGIQREGELQLEGGLLKELYDGGAKFVRYGHFAPGERPQDPAFLTPQEVVDYLLRLDPVYVEMQKEMAAGASIADTSVGSSALEELEKHKRETRESLDRMREELELIKSADDVDRSHREELKHETKRMQEQLKGWERDGDEMRMKIAQWDEYREQIATKVDLDTLVSRNQQQLGGLQGEVLKLREANERLMQQIDQERINELHAALDAARKDREDLAEQFKEWKKEQERNKVEQKKYHAGAPQTDPSPNKDELICEDPATAEFFGVPHVQPITDSEERSQSMDESEASGSVTAMFMGASHVDVAGGAWSVAGRDVQHFQTGQQVLYYAETLPPLSHLQSPREERMRVLTHVALGFALGLVPTILFLSRR